MSDDDWENNSNWEDLPPKIETKHETQTVQLLWKPFHRVFSDFVMRMSGLPWFNIMSFLRDGDVLRLVCRTSHFMQKHLQGHVRIWHFTKNMIPLSKCNVGEVPSLDYVPILLDGKCIDKFYRDDIYGRGFSSKTCIGYNFATFSICNAPFFFERVYNLVSASLDKQGETWDLGLKHPYQRELFYYSNKSVYLVVRFPTVLNLTIWWALFDVDQFNYLTSVFPNIKTLIIFTDCNATFKRNLNLVLFTLAKRKNIELFINHYT